MRYEFKLSGADSLRLCVRQSCTADKPGEYEKRCKA